MTPDYVFRPMTLADLPLIQRWLMEPHVVQWWGDPAEQYDLVSGDLDEPAMDQFIVSTAGSDFAYLPCLNSDHSGVEMLHLLLRRELAGWIGPS